MGLRLFPRVSGLLSKKQENIQRDSPKKMQAVLKKRQQAIAQNILERNKHEKLQEQLCREEQKLTHDFHDTPQGSSSRKGYLRRIKTLRSEIRKTEGIIAIRQKNIEANQNIILELEQLKASEDINLNSDLIMQLEEISTESRLEHDDLLRESDTSQWATSINDDFEGLDSLAGELERERENNTYGDDSLIERCVENDLNMLEQGLK